MAALTATQGQIIDITQKVGSALSIVGESFVITTFLFSSKFRKPINRLVFYATWGNIFSNVATLIGRSSITLGLDSPLCQFQAFLIQWFMPADALWIFAMACNVWLSFFRHYDAPKLRSLEWRYLVACYTIPMIPAFIFLFVATENMGRVYGDAVLWCWISIEWDFFRVGLFYAPVWVMILLTIAIYMRVGMVILKWRRQLISMGRRSEQQLRRNQLCPQVPVDGIRRTDEVTISREPMRGSNDCWRTQKSFTRETEKQADQRVASRIRERASTLTKSRSWGSKGTFRQASTRANKAAIKYCKCALLFFIALLVTWVPSTINRIYNLIYPEDVIFGLEFAAALVLPLQGFWNSVVYVATSVYACKCLGQDLLAGIKARRNSLTDSLSIKWCKRLWVIDGRSRQNTESDTMSLRSVRP